ncbi:MAG: acetyl-CoA decarbonylase/synthase complex subunit beta, partial [Candidatus Bathyarchaeota archaeon]|nr:acetyl-CoA decarbonylase/synthase complex subunit beta [Candidatus Bathyarchaeota archaeon]
MFKDMPVEVGVIYEGERVRKAEMQVEFGGTEVQDKFELVRVRKPESIEDGKVTIIGPDIKEMKPDSNSPLGIIIEVAGEQVEQALEGVIERRIHYYCNYIEGLMHLNQRYDIWVRLNKKSFEKGFNSL